MTRPPDAPCEYCKGSRIPGIHIPTDFDDREGSHTFKVWVAKCDACDKYASDLDAAIAIHDLTGWEIKRSYDRDDEIDPKERAEKQGTDYFRPYFACTIGEADALHGESVLVLQLDRPLEPGEAEQVRVLFNDAFGEFMGTRENVELYVAKRYDTKGEAWRAEKVKEVKARLALAATVKRASIRIK